MVVISNTSLRSNVYETVYDLLTNNIGSYTSSSQPTVKASYTSDSKNLPEIVLYPVDVDSLDFNFGQSSPSREVRVMIDVYSKKMKDLDILADNIDNLLYTKISGLQLIGKSESTAFETPNNNKLHLKTLTFTFLRK
jgi:hypothetical protein